MHPTLTPDQMHLSVDGLIFTVRQKELVVLLAQRTNPPHAGQWALPGRLVGLSESADEAMQALLAEMLPGTATYSEQLYTFTAPHRDARGRVVTVAHLVLLPWEQLAQHTHSPLKCFTIWHEPDGIRLLAEDGTTLSPADLAFDHGHVLTTGIARLQGKIDYTDVAFHLLQDMLAFSLSELQAVFEAVLHQQLDASNFRRGILGKYEATGRLTQTAQAKKQGRGRPAALYQFQPQK